MITMKKIKNFSKVIGIVLRGGIYGPSNELSEQKIRNVYALELGLVDSGRNPLTMSAAGFGTFEQIAAKHGYKVMVIQRGLNR